MISGELNRAQFAHLVEEVKRRELPQKKRQRLLWRIAKYGIIVAAKRNQRDQADQDGRAWAPRKRGKKKMLRNLPKLIKIKELPATESVRLYLSGGRYHSNGKSVAAGAVGYTQQHGMTATVSAKNIKKAVQTEMATKQQAKKLRALDYKIRQKGKYKKAPLGYITSNITRAQAGLIIKTLKGTPIKKSWTIEIPARAFLGINDKDLINSIMRQLQGIGYGTE